MIGLKLKILANLSYSGHFCRLLLLPATATAAAKSLQSCPTLCDPIDGSPPGSPVPGILQARTLEWVATSFSSAWKWKVKGKSLSRLCHLMDYSLPGFSVHGIFQARVLEWVAISFSRGSSWPRDRTQIACIAGRRFTLWATREALSIYLEYFLIFTLPLLFFLLSSGREEPFPFYLLKCSKWCSLIRIFVCVNLPLFLIPLHLSFLPNNPISFWIKISSSPLLT